MKLKEEEKNQVVTNLKNSKLDITQKIKFWPNSKTQIVKNSNCDTTLNVKKKIQKF